MPRGGARPGAGRPRGIPNQTTIDLKNAVVEAFERAGGADYLLGLAKSDPKTFASLLARCIPTESKNENHNIDASDMIRRIQAGRDRVAAAKLRASGKAQKRLVSTAE
jgi:hypothetical protein